MFFEEASLKHKAHRNQIDKLIGADPHKPPKVKPITELAASSKKFLEKRPKASLEWHGMTGTPMFIQGDLSAPIRGTTSEVSRVFLMENRDLLGISEDLEEFYEIDAFEWEGLQHVRYQQTYQGFPIFGAELLVAVNPNNKVNLIVSDCYKEISLKPEKEPISLKKARQIALEDIGKDAILSGGITYETVIYPSSQGHVKVYHLSIPTQEPLGNWDYFIDVQTGKIVDSFNSIRLLWGSRARIYPENPEETPLETYMLRNLKHPKKLNGYYCKVFNEDSPEAVAGANYRFDYPPENTHFDECQVYYSVEKVYDYFRELGFRGFKVNNPYGKIHNGQLGANVHVGTNYNNAFYHPWTGMIYFGDGSYPPSGLNDLSKEVDVIAHEFTHAVIDEYRRGIGGIDGHALHEGYSDYFACSLMNDDELGEYVAPAPERPGIIRSVDNNDQYPGAPKWPHARGKVWGGACWDLRKEVGQQVADYLIFGSILYMRKIPTFKSAKDWILLIDKLLCGGEYRSVIKKAFETDRGIPV